MYDGTLMKIINFGMHGWVIGNATLEAHSFTIDQDTLALKRQLLQKRS